MIDIRFVHAFWRTECLSQRHRIESADIEASKLPFDWKHAGHISWSQKPGQGESHQNGFAGISFTLFHNCDDFDVILIDCDDAPICWQSHRLHSHEGCARRRFKYILLDSFDVHNETFVPNEGRRRGRLSGCR